MQLNINLLIPIVVPQSNDYLVPLTDLSAGQAVHAAAGGLQRGAAGEGDRAVRRQVQVRHPRHRLVQPVTQDLLPKIFGERQKIFAERDLVSTHNTRAGCIQTDLLRAAAAAPGANVSPH